jgi:hypothetical protein
VVVGAIIDHSDLGAAMTESAKKIFRKALDLSPAERAALVDELLLSLDKRDPNIDEVWR